MQGFKNLICSALLETEYHKPAMAENFAKRNVRVKRTSKRLKKRRTNFKESVILEATFNRKRIQRLKLCFTVLHKP